MPRSPKLRSVNRLEEARRLLSAYERQHRLKRSQVRETILAAFAKHDHVTARTLFHHFLRQQRRFGLATIYKNMNLFCRAGIAQAHRFGTQMHYDHMTLTGQHDHLLCTDCGGIWEFHNPDIAKHARAVAQRNGFFLGRQRLELYGLCADCWDRRHPTEQ